MTRRCGFIARFDGFDEAFMFLQDTQQIAGVAARVALHKPHEAARRWRRVSTVPGG